MPPNFMTQFMFPSGLPGMPPGSGGFSPLNQQQPFVPCGLANPFMPPPQANLPPFSPLLSPRGPYMPPGSPSLASPLNSFPIPNSPPTEEFKPTFSPQPVSTPPNLFDDFDLPATPKTPPQPQPQPTPPQQQQLPQVQFTNQLGNLGSWFSHVFPTVQNPDRYKDQLKLLSEMGWCDKDECLKALDRMNGDVMKAVEFLLSNQTSTVTL
jgi:hypothetical protein